MVKLSAAKCPSCGADIEVNEKLEQTICQYCGTTILIEDAVQKYKIELSGKVEVDGIVGRNQKFSQAKKHIEINEYDAAIKLLNEIVKDDQFDVEAYCELLKINLNKLGKKYDFKKISKDQSKDIIYLISDAEKYYERIQKIDKEGIAEKELKDYMDSINYYLNFTDSSEYDEFQNELDKIHSMLVSIPYNRLENSDSYEEDWKNIVLEKYFSASKKLHLIDDLLKGNWDSSNNFQKNKRNIGICQILKAEKVDNLEGLKQKVQNLEKDTDEYINKIIKENNKKANKIIKKEKKERRSRITWLTIQSLITIGLLLFTLSGFLKGIGWGIACIIFIDSWTIPMIKPFIEENIDDIKYKNSSIKEKEKYLIIKK